LVSCHRQLRSVIGNVAHDLKTPVQSIALGVELLRDEIAELRAELPNNQLIERFEQIVHSIGTTCLFMSVAINRSIQFARDQDQVAFSDPVKVRFSPASSIVKTIAWISSLHGSAVRLVASDPPADVSTWLVSDEHWCVFVLEFVVARGFPSTRCFMKSHSHCAIVLCLMALPPTSRFCENLTCLLSNAIKHSPPAGEVRVSCSLEDARHPAVNACAVDGIARLGKPQTPPPALAQFKVAVTDAGAGVPVAMVSQIFKPFQTGDSRIGGTGLGAHCRYRLAQTSNAF
jgi:signal transduction histidine kinase